MVNDQWSWQFGESDEATAFHVTVKRVHRATKGSRRRGDIANDLSGDSGHQPGSSAARPRPNRVDGADGFPPVTGAANAAS